MVMCLTPCNPRTSQLLSPTPAPPIPSHTFPPALLPLLPSPLLCANLISTPSLLPTVLQRGTFLLGGCSSHIHHTSFSPPSSHAVLLPSLAMLLYLDSPIGHVPLSHIPSTLLAMLFPRRGMLLLYPPSSCTLYLTRAQTYCPRPPTSSFFTSPPPHHFNVCLGTGHCSVC